jgi:hypothetical protein
MRRFKKIDIICFISVLICWVFLSSFSNMRDSIKTPVIMKIKSKWVKEHFLDEDAQLPFSFIYDGKPSSDLLKTWQKKTETNKLDNNRTQYTHIWTDSKTGLEVRCISVEYLDYSVLEWTVYIKNTGTSNTSNLKNIQGLDAIFKRNKKSEFVLHYNTGDLCREYSYEPHRKQLDPATV